MITRLNKTAGSKLIDTIFRVADIIADNADTEETELAINKTAEAAVYAITVLCVFGYEDEELHAEFSANAAKIVENYAVAAESGTPLHTTACIARIMANLAKEYTK